MVLNCVESRTFGLDVVHGHGQILGLEVGQKPQAAGAGAQEPVDLGRNLHGAAQGVGDGTRVGGMRRDGRKADQAGQDQGRREQGEFHGTYLGNVSMVVIYIM
jgi:hypothetical protein